MHEQLSAIVIDLEQASARLNRLADWLGEDRWGTRSDPARWSAAECVAHLNLTSRAYLPVLDAGLAHAATLAGPRVPKRLHRDFVGWLIWKASLPTSAAKSKTAAAFVPSGNQPRQQLLDEFAALQREQIARVEAADGLPIHRVWVRSLFNKHVKYNLYSCFTILAAHQLRHLAQAERVWA